LRAGARAGERRRAALQRKTERSCLREVSRRERGRFRQLAAVTRFGLIFPTERSAFRRERIVRRPKLLGSPLRRLVRESLRRWPLRPRRRHSLFPNPRG